jgi:crotonobetainyl-CoA:carnitine CoA-transferase CaiB-like acyl-CoA transferase
MTPTHQLSDAPLHGLRVVEFGQFIAVPAAGQALVDLGADVVKVEPPGGDAARHFGWNRDGFGPMFTAYNRGKRSVMLDLRQPGDLVQAQRLCQAADVVLQNARPGAMDKLGLGAQALTAQAPRLVYGQVSGFGQTGPASTRPGLDIAAQAESGMMSLNGEGQRDPVRVGFTVVDVLTGHHLATGVLAALLRRGRTGLGGVVDISLVDVAVGALAQAWAEYGLMGQEPTRRGNGQPNAAPAAELVQVCGGQVMLSAYTPDHFARLCQAIGQPGLAQDPRFATNADRVRHRSALLALVGDALRDQSPDQVCALLNQAGVVAGAVRSLSQVHPGHNGVSHDLFVRSTAPGRAPTQVPGMAMTVPGVVRQDGALPALGAHNQSVLDDWGLV